MRKYLKAILLVQCVKYCINKECFQTVVLRIGFLHKRVPLDKTHHPPTAKPVYGPEMDVQIEVTCNLADLKLYQLSSVLERPHIPTFSAKHRKCKIIKRDGHGKVMEKYFVKSVETLICVVNSYIKGAVWVKIQVGHLLAKLKGGEGGGVVREGMYSLCSSSIQTVLR